MKLAPDRLIAAGTAARATRLNATELQRLRADTTTTRGWHLSLLPIGPDGFPIDLTGSSDRICSCFGGLEVEFETLSAALVWVERALSDAYQLRTTFVGARPREWRLEPVDDHISTDVLEFGYPIVFKSLRSRFVVVRRNALAAT